MPTNTAPHHSTTKHGTHNHNTVWHHTLASQHNTQQNTSQNIIATHHPQHTSYNQSKFCVSKTSAWEKPRERQQHSTECCVCERESNCDRYRHRKSSEREICEVTKRTRGTNSERSTTHDGTQTERQGAKETSNLTKGKRWRNTETWNRRQTWRYRLSCTNTTDGTKRKSTSTHNTSCNWHTGMRYKQHKDRCRHPHKHTLTHQQIEIMNAPSAWTIQTHEHKTTRTRQNTDGKHTKHTKVQKHRHSWLANRRHKTHTRHTPTTVCAHSHLHTDTQRKAWTWKWSFKHAESATWHWDYSHFQHLSQIQRLAQVITAKYITNVLLLTSSHPNSSLYTHTSHLSSSSVNVSFKLMTTTPHLTSVFNSKSSQFCSL